MAKKAETRLSENDEVNRILHEGIMANPEGRHAEVLEPLKRAVGLEPENPVTHMIYGQTLLPLGGPAQGQERLAGPPRPSRRLGAPRSCAQSSRRSTSFARWPSFT